MKKLVFTVAVSLCTYAVVFAQPKIPYAVTEAFTSKFPNAKEVKWGRENTKEYEAEFLMEGLNYSANFSDKGFLLETESPVSLNSLPEKVKVAWNKSHKSETVKMITLISRWNGSSLYEFEISKGVKKIEKFLNSEGIEVKK
jgi:hypothetical protein